MRERLTSIVAVLAALVALGAADCVGADQTLAEPVLGPFAGNTSGDEALGESQRRAVDWLAEYASVQILFRPADLEALRSRVAAMTEDRAQRWLNDTEALRSDLDAERWRTTRLWFRDYLARRSGGDDELAGLREETSRMSPAELRDLLLKIERQRTRLHQQQVRSERDRRQRLALTRAIAQRERSLRNDASWRRYNAVHPMNFSAPGRQRASHYHLPGPLITSRGVAQAAVWAAIFSDWCD